MARSTIWAVRCKQLFPRRLQPLIMGFQNQLPVESNACGGLGTRRAKATSLLVSYVSLALILTLVVLLVGRICGARA